MTLSAILCGLVLSFAPPADSAADAVVLRDGSVVLGQVVETTARGKLLMVVRRAWAQTHQPDRAKRWEQVEATWSKRARQQRRERVQAWKRERVQPDRSADAIAPWLDSEIKRLEGEPAQPPPLMSVEIDRGQIRALVRRQPEAARMLRQAWRGGIADPETTPLAELRPILEGRGFALGDVDPAAIDGLLPLPLETEPRWLSRRAATEVSREPGLRLIRYLDFVMPEGANAAGAEVVGAAVSALKSLLGEDPGDPLAPKLADAAGRGRVGVVVTRLAMAEDFSGVTVESTLWVRTGPNQWVPAVTRPATLRPDTLPPEEGRPLAADPQVEAAFRAIQRLGLGAVSPEMKQRSLNVGAAARRALGMAQSALARDLDALALPVDDMAAAVPKREADAAAR